jgi:tRNA A-37 threonylcarbamoyl transferase component Bud32
LEVLFQSIGVLRLKFKPLTGRNIIKIHEYIVKTYNDADESAYEYNVLSNIALFKPIAFKVPKVFKLLKIRGRSTLIMEYIAGRHLDKYILNFLLCGNSDAVKIFYRLGKAVKELHNLGLDGLRGSSLPSSCSELKNEIVELSKRLVAWRLIDHKLSNAILNSLEKVDLSDEIFFPASLHGELYFTHILLQDGKIILLDFHNAQKGPSYFDLAMFSTSLYISLAFPLCTQKQFTLLIEAFWKGYYGKNLNTDLIISLKLAELYVALRGVLTYTRDLCAKNSPAIRLITTFKIRRLIASIKKVILPKLIL